MALSYFPYGFPAYFSKVEWTLLDPGYRIPLLHGLAASFLAHGAGRSSRGFALAAHKAYLVFITYAGLGLRHALLGAFPCQGSATGSLVPSSDRRNTHFIPLYSSERKIF